MPDSLSVSLMCLARREEDAITEPAPFLDERVSLSLIVLSLKCIAAGIAFWHHCVRRIELCRLHGLW